MNDITPFRRKTSKKGIDASVTEGTPAKEDAPIFSARPDAGSQSEVVHNRPSEVSDGLSAQQQPTLAWPPTKEDLQRLYVDEKLSAAKIAKVYQLNTPNPKSAVELVRYHLKRNGIERRNRIQELCKETEATVAAWKEKHPEQESPDMELEKSAVLELLRNEGLSIEHLDQETKGRVRAVMDYLHWLREISMTDIAELIGSKTSGYVSWLFKKIEVKARDFDVGRLKGIHDKVRIHERKPFEGTDEDKAYMLGLKHGDLYAYNPFG